MDTVMGERLLVPGTNDYSIITTTTTTTGGSTTTKTSTSIQSSSTNKAANSKNSMIRTDAASARVSDKPSVQEQQAALKCPRCESSNTKFCYYNNYSLSQPRHFCKACKRYWTRGGTLRNVPVGGGCRKNKRVKKPAANASSATLTGAVSGVTSNRHPLLSRNPMASLSIQPTTSHIDASLLYALQSSSAMNQALPGLGGDAQIPSTVTTAFDLQSHLSALELGFSSAQCNNDYQLGHQDQHIPQVNSEVLPQMMTDGSINSAASLLVSSLKQSNKAENHPFLIPYEDLHASGMDFGMFKDAKFEEKQGGNLINSSSSCSDYYQWHIPPGISTSTMTAFGSGAVNCFNASAADSLYQLSWNTAAGGGGGWPDVYSYGSSVAPPLI